MLQKPAGGQPEAAVWLCGSSGCCTRTCASGPPGGGLESRVGPPYPRLRHPVSVGSGGPGASLCPVSSQVLLNLQQGRTVRDRPVRDRPAGSAGPGNRQKASPCMQLHFLRTAFSQQLGSRHPEGPGVVKAPQALPLFMASASRPLVSGKGEQLIETSAKLCRASSLESLCD